ARCYIGAVADGGDADAERGSYTEPCHARGLSFLAVRGLTGKTYTLPTRSRNAETEPTEHKLSR
ncbi:MAG: hypothetical protein V1796_03730, partial [Pseudomonadota bacterium]